MEMWSSICPSRILFYSLTTLHLLCCFTWWTWRWVRLQLWRTGCRRERVEWVRRKRPHMVLRSWIFWHISRMLTQSVERLSTGTDLTDSAQLLTCRGTLIDMRTKIARWFKSFMQPLNQSQFLMAHVNFLLSQYLLLCIKDVWVDLICLHYYCLK